MAASWPTTIATDSTLYVAVNELQNNLSGAINSAVTTVGLNSTTSFPTVGLVLIDNEVIKYTGISGNNLTGCTRAFDGTTAAAHSSAAIVSFAFCAAHHNNLKDEVIAVETSLNFTASKAISSDTNGRLAVATTTLAELNFVAGVTSAIQTQLNAKAPTASPTFTGTITTPLTANRAVATGASGVLAASATTDTELGYVSGVTSAIQTQLNTKGPFQAAIQATDTSTTTTTLATYQSTGVTASITPVSASHRVRVTVSGQMSVSNPSADGVHVSVKRGSTELSTGGTGFNSSQSGGGGLTGILKTAASFSYIDSPATTGATTYTVVVKTDNAGQTVQWNPDGITCVIILEEIL